MLLRGELRKVETWGADDSAGGSEADSRVSLFLRGE